MEYRGLFIVNDRLDASFCGCCCEVHLTEARDRCIDEFFISPFELGRTPDVDALIRRKINERYKIYASCGYVPKSVSER